MARQDFQKVCRSFCIFQTYSQQESFCGKKRFFSFTCALILDANLVSIQRLKNILRFFTCALNLFKPKIKFLFQTILILSQFVEKMKLAANEQACQDGTVPKLTHNRSIPKETRNLKQKWGNLLFWKISVDMGLKNRESHDGLGATRDRKVQPICEMLSY